MNVWVSTSTLDEIADALRNAPDAVLLTHEKPDGDALGSTLALARALTRLGADATPVYSGAWSARFDPIVGATPVLRLGETPDLSALPDDPAVIVIADTGAWSQLTTVRPWLEPRVERAVVLDHHLHGDPGVAPRRHIDTGDAAVCQSVALLCRRLLCVDRIDELPASIAEPLYLGLATDTGWFRHSNVSPEALRLAADLLDAGADHARLYRLIEQSESPCRLRLIGRALASMALIAGGAGAVITLSLEDVKACGASGDDTGGLADMPLAIGSVRASATITEIGARRAKVSLRSKSADGDEPAVDVNRVARALGGGGHAQAAGARLDLPLDEARARVIDALEAALQ